MSFEKVIKELQDYIRSLPRQEYVAEHPVGISITENGFIHVKHTTTYIKRYSTIEEAVEYISSFLKYNRRTTDPAALIHYAGVGFRYVVCYPPSNYDRYGFNEKGQSWQYNFGVIDDFGNVVPVNPFNHYAEGYTATLVPDYNAPTPPGKPYKYVLHYPTIH